MNNLPEPKVVDLASATEYMAKIRKVKELIVEKSKVAKDRIKKLQEEIKENEDWIKEETEEDKIRIKYYETELLRYWNEQHSNNQKFKLSTPYGRIKTRKQPLKYVYEEESFKNWLVTNKPDLLRKKEVVSIDKIGLKRFFELSENGVVFTETGEIVDIISIKEQPEKIEIEVK